MSRYSSVEAVQISLALILVFCSMAKPPRREVAIWILLVAPKIALGPAARGGYPGAP